MISLKLEREFITKKHETNRVFRRYNRLGQDLGTQWVRSKPSKDMLELAEFVGDRALMPVDMHSGGVRDMTCARVVEDSNFIRP